MITPEYIDRLAELVHSSPFCLEKAQEIAGECLDESGGAINPRGSYLNPLSPQLRNTFVELVRAHSESDGKRFAKACVEIARQEL